MLARLLLSHFLLWGFNTNDTIVSQISSKIACHCGDARCDPESRAGQRRSCINTLSHPMTNGSVRSGQAGTDDDCPAGGDMIKTIRPPQKSKPDLQCGRVGKSVASASGMKSCKCEGGCGRPSKEERRIHCWTRGGGKWTPLRNSRWTHFGNSCWTRGGSRQCVDKLESTDRCRQDTWKRGSQ